ncbi:MAG: Signal-peptide peptidase, presenilin aspartyl protease [Candidatus Argoarchaeum ethanivorans]|uniref:Signal-peptide peptidase, presenilin aspartyl protease n=1 Tax=Candidatus Argoarchaeum ethanivorans TaxID=2608793 RepID=A0A811TH30_9EURY|nr:MAG: Signal-peptide peptidase, presenilin aspartyl protease [Candidatus Argoarchaeum ethanivorans]
MAKSESGLLVPVIIMGLLMLVVELIALFLGAPLDAAGIRAFEDPDSPANSLYYIGFILLFTLFILLIIKWDKKWMIQLMIFGAIISTIYYVLCPLFVKFFPLNTSIVLSVSIAVILALILYVFPEWYIIDFVGLIVGAGAAAIFGISLSIVPVLVLLVLLAVYDAIAVYQTKHMVALAEGVMDLRLPILFIVPKHRGYSFREETFDKEERDAFFMGLGDAVIPSVLVVSAYFFTGSLTIAVFAIIGSLIGFAVLMRLVLKGNPQAGLPFLNTGVIIGYVIGALVVGIPVI